MAAPEARMRLRAARSIWLPSQLMSRNGPELSRLFVGIYLRSEHPNQPRCYYAMVFSTRWTAILGASSCSDKNAGLLDVCARTNIINQTGVPVSLVPEIF